MPYGEKDLEVTFGEKEWNRIVPQMLLPMRDARSKMITFKV
jgi:hypothetical protein